MAACSRARRSCCSTPERPRFLVLKVRQTGLDAFRKLLVNAVTHRALRAGEEVLLAAQACAQRADGVLQAGETGERSRFWARRLTEVTGLLHHVQRLPAALAASGMLCLLTPARASRNQSVT